jgi:ATP-dependent DNA helicase 2 subunit 1
VIYLIESTNTMISPDAPESTVPDTTQRTKLNWIGRPAKSKLELTLRCALALMRRKIISAPKDKVAIVLYNTVRS